MKSVKPRRLSRDLLVGIWRSVDEFTSAVEYRVTKKKTGYVVVVCDTSDGELAEVFDTMWKKEDGVLSFAAHWPSTGRFSRCQMRLISESQVAFTFTYTDTDVLHRK